MPNLSRLALLLTVVTACGGEVVAPPSVTYPSATVTPLAPPTDLRASLLSDAGDVLITWSYGSRSGDNFGFLVERAPDSMGPWSTLIFTRETSVGDTLNGKRNCYRVAAVSSSSSLDAPRSNAVCVDIPPSPT